MRIAIMAIAIFGVVLMLWFGGYLMFQGIRNVLRAGDSKRWPTTAGNVVDAETSRTISTDRHSQDVHVDYTTKTVIAKRSGSPASA